MTKSSRREFLTMLGTAGVLSEPLLAKRETGEKYTSELEKQYSDFALFGEKLPKVLKEAIKELSKIRKDKLSLSDIFFVEDFEKYLDAIGLAKDDPRRIQYRKSTIQVSEKSLPIIVNGQSQNVQEYLKNPRLFYFLISALIHELEHVYNQAPESVAYQKQYEYLQPLLRIGQIPKEYAGRIVELGRLADEWKKREKAI